MKRRDNWILMVISTTRRKFLRHTILIHREWNGKDKIYAEKPIFIFFTLFFWVVDTAFKRRNVRNERRRI